MHLETAGGLSTENATEQDVEQAFQDDAGRAEYVQLTAEDGSSIQASGEGEGPFLLQYVDVSGQVFTARGEVSQSEAKEALLDYLHGGTAWHDARPWISEQSGAGCLPVILLAFPFPLSVWLAWWLP